MLDLAVKSSLQRRIVLLVASGAFLVFVGLGTSSWLAMRQSVDQILAARLTLAKTVAHHLDFVLSQNLSLLENVVFAEGVDIEDDDPEPERRALHSAYLASLFNDGVFMVDRNGGVLCAEPRPLDYIGSSVRGYPHIGEALEQGKPVVSDLHIVEPSGKKVISAVAPFRDKKGLIGGAVVGYIDPTAGKLLQLIAPDGLAGGSHMELVDSQGTLLAGTSQEGLLAPSDHAAALTALIEDKKAAVHIAPAEKREVVALAPLETDPWGVNIRQPEAEALALVSSMRQRFTIFGASALVLALLLGWGLARSVVRPVRLLTAAADRISAGNLTDPIPALADDEIGGLGRSFDSMRRELKASLEQIQEWNRELENRVEQRTGELATLYEELQRKEAVRSELLRKVISAQEEERRRIARELHDETSQSLAALVMALDQAAAPVDDRGQVQVTKMKAMAVRSLDSLRQIIFDLRPAILDDLGLLAAVGWYAENRLESQGVKVRLETDGQERRLPSQVETALFRAVQEAITNIAKHADASNAAISIDFKEAAVSIEVEDDGKGFDVEAVASSPDLRRGLGLLGMRERVSLLGGSLDIESRPGGGTRLLIEVPLAAVEGSNG